ncbi:TPA: hypothetical protein L5613_004993 [Pseudomonas aeruginosa]|nr:hypothetical protein [Pseudomonas aeruginosa]MWB70709.1 hypothetical protein [Pseudomonas aeruginosa]HBP4877311.1 hypothetical protein [Pseudomonas aeruginosa]HBP5177437.1 hypothetical protein [Pseudomonas aeruginosa]
MKIRALWGTAGRAARSASLFLTNTKPVLGMALGMISDAILASIDCTVGNANGQSSHHETNSRCLTCGHRFNLPA